MTGIKAKNKMKDEYTDLLIDIASRSRSASAELSRASSGSKNNALNKMAQNLISKAEYIISENQKRSFSPFEVIKYLNIVNLFSNIKVFK